MALFSHEPNKAVPMFLLRWSLLILRLMRRHCQHSKNNKVWVWAVFGGFYYKTSLSSIFFFCHSQIFQSWKPEVRIFCYWLLITGQLVGVERWGEGTNLGKNVNTEHIIDPANKRECFLSTRLIPVGGLWTIHTSIYRLCVVMEQLGIPILSTKFLTKLIFSI